MCRPVPEPKKAQEITAGTIRVKLQPSYSFNPRMHLTAIMRTLAQRFYLRVWLSYGKRKDYAFRIKAGQTLCLKFCSQYVAAGKASKGRFRKYFLLLIVLYLKWPKFPNSAKKIEPDSFLQTVRLVCRNCFASCSVLVIQVSVRQSRSCTCGT